VIRGGTPFSGRQGLSYFEGVSAQSAGSERLCMLADAVHRQPRPGLRRIMRGTSDRMY
jgi:uncharacterized RmlC-like cupin family protein